MENTFRGSDNKNYTLVELGGDKKPQGGEGRILGCKDNSEYVAKIFFPNARTDTKRRKLEFMIRNPPKGPEYLSYLSWPEILLYDNRNNLAGYLMKNLTNCKELRNDILLKIYDPETGDLANKKYTWKFLVGVATNISAAVYYLHKSNNYVIGDLNSANVMVRGDGHVILIDTDSFQTSEYSCGVAKQQFLPPELQGKSATDKDFKFTKETDLFSLSIIIFQLLMNAAHPFTNVSVDSGGLSSGSNNPDQGIAKQYSPFIADLNHHTVYSPSLNSLPKDIQELFRRAFLSTNPMARPTAYEWYKCLSRLLSKDIVTCKSHSHHMYYKGAQQCPWCVIMKDQQELRKQQKDSMRGGIPPVRIPPSPGQTPPRPPSPGQTPPRPPSPGQTPPRPPSPSQTTSRPPGPGQTTYTTYRRGYGTSPTLYSRRIRNRLIRAAIGFGGIVSLSIALMAAILPGMV